MPKIARISFNSSGWLHPTGDARKCEAPDTYNHKFGFGHEDWLFRFDWLLDGWHYGFIQGFNKPRFRRGNQTFDLTLYTIEPDGRYRFVANIYSLECLSSQQSKDALEAYRENGWLETMKREVESADGNPTALGDATWVEEILNLRFRVENVDSFPADTFADADDRWLKNRHRYQLYEFTAEYSSRLESKLRGRQGSQSPPVIRSFFRCGARSVEISPEHRKMQTRLLVELQREYGADRVALEEDFVDATVRTDREKVLYEIKTDLEPRTVIRGALGQILEYAYYPVRQHDLPLRLVIVGRCPLTKHDQDYLKRLQTEFSLPLEYRAIKIE